MWQLWGRRSCCLLWLQLRRQLGQHRDQQRSQGLQQQWGTQGVKDSSFSSLHLRAGSLENQKSLLGHRTPGSWDWMGWRKSAKPCRHMQLRISKQPQGISGAPAPALLSHPGLGGQE